MIKILKNLPARIALSFLIAFFFAGTSAHIQYPCEPETANGGCVSFEKAAMHPKDLFANKQDSLRHFSIFFIVSALTSFALLSLYSYRKKTVNIEENK